MVAGRRYKNKPRCTLRYNGAEYIVRAGSGHRFFRMQKRSHGMQLSYPEEGFRTKIFFRSKSVQKAYYQQPGGFYALGFAEISSYASFTGVLLYITNAPAFQPGRNNRLAVLVNGAQYPTSHAFLYS